MQELKTAFTALLRNERGAIAIQFGLAIVPLIAMLGLAADYSLASARRSDLQQVLDATALSLARDSDIDKLNAAQANTRAQAYANVMGQNLPIKGLSVNAKVTPGEVILDGTGDVALNFGKFLGSDNLAIKSSVTVSRATSQSLEIALALDNTGSMNDSSKIVELRKAVKALVAYLQDPNKNKSPTKIAMVPFNTAVRANATDAPDSIFLQAKPNNWNGCIIDRDEPYNTNDNAPLPGVDASKFHWGTWEKVWVPGNNGNGYGWGRGRGRGRGDDDDERGNNGTWEDQYVATDCGNTLAKIIPLTTDLGSVSKAADGLIAGGATNLTIGVAWGMHALMPGVPLSQGSPEGTINLVRALIVLTDGMNTADKFGDNNNSAIDKRSLAACTAAKAKGITVYTIHLIDGNAAVLQSCATNQDSYFYVKQASELTPLFEKIAGQLTRLRISR